MNSEICTLVNALLNQFITLEFFSLEANEGVSKVPLNVCVVVYLAPPEFTCSAISEVERETT